ncbi:MAG: DUF1573 domain-containing protein [Bacteroidota bacterium]
MISIPLKAQDNLSVLIFDGKNISTTTPEKCIDFGFLQRKQSMNYTLQIKNQSDIPLKISNVRGSCGLSVPSYPRKTIAAGQQNKIKIRYDTSRLGRFTRNLTIHSNSEKNITIICITGEVQTPAKP